MTLENISNIDGLFAVINQCTGNVELISDEGDCINLEVPPGPVHDRGRCFLRWLHPQPTPAR